jgi:hypothetical protein
MMNHKLSPFSLTRVRRNHALEHATLNVLSEKSHRQFLVGYSDFRGFWIVGHTDTDDLQMAVDEALARLRRGESRLAISANCGTNFATNGLLAGSAAWLAMANSGKNWKQRLERLPMVVALVSLVLMFAQPLGPLLQARVTTEPRIGDLRITGISIYERNGVPVHRVMTA